MIKTSVTLSVLAMGNLQHLKKQVVKYWVGDRVTLSILYPEFLKNSIPICRINLAEENALCQDFFSTKNKYIYLWKIIEMGLNFSFSNFLVLLLFNDYMIEVFLQIQYSFLIFWFNLSKCVTPFFVGKIDFHLYKVLLEVIGKNMHH